MKYLYKLSNELIFPPLQLSQSDGLLALGGDLSIDRLLLAYRSGIFPWYNDDSPILWWSPDPRFVVTPSEVIVSSSMKKVLKKNLFSVSLDKNFRAVITNCKKVREQTGTWITDEMLEAYCELHDDGYAHSVEVFREGELVGGLYGVSIGLCFFGESMFSLADNASKTGFIILSKLLKEKNFGLIDCQVYTNHLKSLGAYNIEREKFISLIAKYVKYETFRNDWNEWLDGRSASDFV
ncbi:MAG: leucyl/phenylalanyl-tRNA--protein transferase [Spirochaetes bacterium]|nr:leucyl/phenylalanyl-tRNA--protein transferase [Spirochaetota bacterium]